MHENEFLVALNRLVGKKRGIWSRSHSVSAMIVGAEKQLDKESPMVEMLKGELESVIREEIGVEKEISAFVVANAGSMLGKCFRRRSRRRAAEEDPIVEAFKVLAIDWKGDLKGISLTERVHDPLSHYVRAYYGRVPMVSKLLQQSAVEFEGMARRVEGKLVSIPEAIPTQLDLHKTLQEKILEMRGKLFDLSNPETTFPLMDSAERLMVEAIDHFKGRCYTMYKDADGNSDNIDAIIGAVHDKTFKKDRVECIHFSTPFLDDGGVEIATGTFQPTPFMTMQEIPREKFISMVKNITVKAMAMQAKP